MLVSHDRALIDAVATHTASIENRRITLRHGDYNDYLEAIAERPRPAPAPAAEVKAKDEEKQKPRHAFRLRAGSPRSGDRRSALNA